MHSRNRQQSSFRWRPHDNEYHNFPAGCLSLLVMLLCLLATRYNVSARGDETASLRLADIDHAVVTTLLRKSRTAEDFLATHYIDPQPIPDLSAEERGYGYVTFQRHWMDLVFPTSIPREYEKTRKLQTWLRPGEEEPATFCLRTLQQLQDLSDTTDSTGLR